MHHAYHLRQRPAAARGCRARSSAPAADGALRLASDRTRPDITGLSMSPGSLFHPAVTAWFDRSFAAPTAAQEEAWPAIKSGRNVLIAAPTGSGKTLAAFLAAIDGLIWQGLESGALEDTTQIVYVSPLKALSNDIQKNLEAPLAGI